jgi:hypothetical protein
LDKAKEMIEGANTAEHILFVHSISTDWAFAVCQALSEVLAIKVSCVGFGTERIIDSQRWPSQSAVCAVWEIMCRVPWKHIGQGNRFYLRSQSHRSQRSLPILTLKEKKLSRQTSRQEKGINQKEQIKKDSEVHLDSAK